MCLSPQDFYLETASYQRLMMLLRVKPSHCGKKKKKKKKSLLHNSCGVSHYFKECEGRSVKITNCCCVWKEQLILLKMFCPFLFYYLLFLWHVCIISVLLYLPYCHVCHINIISIIIFMLFPLWILPNWMLQTRELMSDKADVVMWSLVDTLSLPPVSFSFFSHHSFLLL